MRRALVAALLAFAPAPASAAADPAPVFAALEALERAIQNPQNLHQHVAPAEAALRAFIQQADESQAQLKQQAAALTAILVDVKAKYIQLLPNQQRELQVQVSRAREVSLQRRLFAPGAVPGGHEEQTALARHRRRAHLDTSLGRILADVRRGAFAPGSTGLGATPAELRAFARVVANDPELHNAVIDPTGALRYTGRLHRPERLTAAAMDQQLFNIIDRQTGGELRPGQRPRNLLTVDGLPGSQTCARIQSFRASLGELDAARYGTGCEMTPALRAALQARAERAQMSSAEVVQRGDTNLGARMLQDRLNALGFTVPVTGTFDAATWAAVLRARAAAGMTPPSDPHLRALTWDRMTAADMEALDRLKAQGHRVDQQPQRRGPPRTPPIAATQLTGDEQQLLAGLPAGVQSRIRTQLALIDQLQRALPPGTNHERTLAILNAYRAQLFANPTAPAGIRPHENVPADRIPAMLAALRAAGLETHLAGTNLDAIGFMRASLVTEGGWQARRSEAGAMGPGQITESGAYACRHLFHDHQVLHNEVANLICSATMKVQHLQAAYNDPILALSRYNTRQRNWAAINATRRVPQIGETLKHVARASTHYCLQTGRHFLTQSHLNYGQRARQGGRYRLTEEWLRLGYDDAIQAGGPHAAACANPAWLTAAR